MSSAGMSRQREGLLSSGENSMDDEVEIISCHNSQKRPRDVLEEPSDNEEATGQAEKEPDNNDGAAGDEDDPNAYFVEAVRARRVNSKTGEEEFLIKWEKWPESSNTWEPKRNLQCPEKLKEFFESARAKKSRTPRRASTNSGSSQNGRSTKRTRHSASASGLRNESRYLLEEESNESSELGEVQREKRSPVPEERPKSPIELKGFERGLDIEEILGSLIGDDNEICFAIKWKDYPKLDLVPVVELEEKAPRQLCLWYRQRLYHNLKRVVVPTNL